MSTTSPRKQASNTIIDIIDIIDIKHKITTEPLTTMFSPSSERSSGKERLSLSSSCSDDDDDDDSDNNDGSQSRSREKNQNIT